MSLAVRTEVSSATRITLANEFDRRPAAVTGLATPAVCPEASANQRMTRRSRPFVQVFCHQLTRFRGKCQMLLVILERVLKISYLDERVVET